MTTFFEAYLKNLTIISIACATACGLMQVLLKRFGKITSLPMESFAVRCGAAAEAPIGPALVICAINESWLPLLSSAPIHIGLAGVLATYLAIAAIFPDFFKA